MARQRTDGLFLSVLIPPLCSCENEAEFLNCSLCRRRTCEVLTHLVVEGLKTNGTVGIMHPSHPGLATVLCSPCQTPKKLLTVSLGYAPHLVS